MWYKKEIGKKKIEPYVISACVLFAVCSLVYYLPTLVGLAGGTNAQHQLNQLHNFYGLDFYALIFFVPVVYVAYKAGVIRAVSTAFGSMVIFTPYSLFITNQPGALFRPTAFVLILSAVGAVVAMLQRGDEQRRRSMNELKCLHDVGKAAESNDSVDKFLTSIVEMIPFDLNTRGEIGLIINAREKIYSNAKISPSKCVKRETISISGEDAGYLEITYPRAYNWDRKSNHFLKTLAERIGGAIHSIELEQSLKAYYEQLEETVESRTHELELTQEKLIRSERLVAVGELASGVGHELRNPLNVMRNCIYLINMSLENKATPEVQDTLKLLDLQVDISNKIVSDLLDFTRVKPPSRSIVDINGMIQDRVSWASISDKILVKYDLNEDPLLLNIDAEQVGRAVTNIINNAVQSINGYGELKISSGVRDGISWVKFTDTGCGIPPENLKRLFEPLFTTKPRGIGLGLAISKRMIEQNGGEIEVESTVGKGTTFTLKIPIIRKEIAQYETAGQHSGCGR